MSVVMGIDPSLTSTGIAILNEGNPFVLHSVGHGTRNGSSYDHRSDRIVSQTRAVIDAFRSHTPAGGYTLAVIEGPAYAHSNASTHDGAGLWWGIYSALRSRRIPTAVVSPQTRTSWVLGKDGRTGSSKDDKKLVLTTVRSWWPDTLIRNDDIADAAVLALLGAFKHGHPMPFPIKPRHYAAIEKINWPEDIRA